MPANPRPQRSIKDAPFGTTTALACLAYTRHCIETEIWYIETQGYDHDAWLYNRRLPPSTVLGRLRGHLFRINQRIDRYLTSDIDKTVPVVPWSNC